MKRGRPPKFQEPRHPITVTLPESTLAQLAAINSDRSRAIVKAATAALPVDPKRKPVELVEVLPGLSVILIGTSRYIRKIKWLRLVEVAPLRFLLTIPTGTAVDSLELALLDLLQNLKPYEDREGLILEGLRDLIRRLRVDGKLSKGELLFVETKSRQGRNRGHRASASVVDSPASVTIFVRTSSTAGVTPYYPVLALRIARSTSISISTVCCQQITRF